MTIAQNFYHCLRIRPSLCLWLNTQIGLRDVGFGTLKHFFSGDGYIPFARLYHLMKEHEAYIALPHKVSQLVLKQLDQDWRSYVLEEIGIDYNHG